MSWNDEQEHTLPLSREQQLEEDRLRDLMRETCPTEPDESAWSRTLAQIEQRLQTVPPVETPSSRRWGWLAAGGAAAAILVAVWLASSPRHPQSTVHEEPFPVAEASEIEILSVNGADTNTLVVGNPLDGDLELLGPGEVTLFSVEAAHDEMIPDIRFHGPNSPMIWAHLDPDNE